MIQVGAYTDEQAAKEQLSLVQRKASLMLTGHFVTSSAGAEAFIDSIEKGGTTLYRARFAGLDKNQAEWACAYLKLNDIECVIVKSQERIEPESRQAPATSARARPEQRQDAQDDAAYRKSEVEPGSIACIACRLPGSLRRTAPHRGDSVGAAPPRLPSR